MFDTLIYKFTKVFNLTLGTLIKDVAVKYFPNNYHPVRFMIITKQRARFRMFFRKSSMINFFIRILFSINI